MTRLFVFLNIFFILIAATTSLAEHSPKPKPRPQQKPHSFVLPVLRDTHTGIYYTNVTIGEPPIVVNLIVDVSGSGLWFECFGYNSTTYTPILCGSQKCKEVKGECAGDTCSGASGPTCGKDTCLGLFYGSFRAYLVEDSVILSYTASPSAYVASNLTARLPLACMSPIRAGIPSDVQGNLGLGSNPKSFVNRLVSSYKIPFKVALCLPSKPGRRGSGLVYIGGGPYLLPPNRRDVSGLLVSTPLVRVTSENNDDSYYIDVKSIEVNGKKLSFNQNLLTFNKKSKTGGTAISTIAYTFLETSIYKALVKAFAGNAKKQKAVAPFGDCFSFGGKSLLGKEIPVISLVLGGGVKWNIYGPNSLVKVSKNVVCLAFRDGADISTSALDIGGYQMQDNLVEFDLEASKFSFTSSLLLHNTSCSRM